MPGRPGRPRNPDPLLRELLGRLPPPGGRWQVADRVRWLRAAVGVFEFLYTSDEDAPHLSVIALPRKP